VVSVQDIILVLTIGLLATYNVVIINFDSITTESLTLDHIISHLLNEEIHQVSGMKQSKLSQKKKQWQSLLVLEDDSWKMAMRRVVPSQLFVTGVTRHGIIRPIVLKGQLT
jgi:hypothetical protein